MNPRLWLRGFILIGSLVALGYALKVSGLGSSIDQGWIDTEIRGRGITGEMLFVAVGFLFTAAGLPRQIICFLGGYAFGFTHGTALGLLATTLGCIAAFSYARILGRDFVASRFPRRVRKIDDFLRDNPLSMTLLIRLLPVGSNLVTNLAAGVSSVRIAPYVAGSVLGYLPQTIIFSLIGSGIALDPELRIGVSVLLFVVSGVMGVYLYRRYRHGKSFDDTVERELGVQNKASQSEDKI